MKNRLAIIVISISLIVGMFGVITATAEDFEHKSIQKICFDYTDGQTKVYPCNIEELNREIDLLQKQSYLSNQGYWGPTIGIHFKKGVDPVTAFENAKDVILKVPHEGLVDHTTIGISKDPCVTLIIQYEQLTEEGLMMLAENEWIDRIVVCHPVLYLNPVEPPVEPPVETGDGAVYGVAVLGVAAVALTVLLLRKKKI